MRVFRVCRAIHAKLDGEGARRVGARWNSPGHAVVYMAESVALAVLENLVHMRRKDFPTGYVVVGAAIPTQMEILSEDRLRAEYGDLSTQALGDRWVVSQRTAILRVKSVVVPGECNYLLNPKHPDFPLIVAELPIPFRFDERLFG
jgi:RES domain-containing protein